MAFGFRWLAGGLLVLAIAACGGGAGSEPDAAVDGGDGGVGPTPISVLVFSKTAGFRHASIEDAVAWLTSLDPAEHIDVTATEDAAVFSDAGLAEFDAVAFVNTTGDFLSDAQQAAFERYIRAGHGFVGVHSATDGEYEWPWFQELIGAWFRTHQVYDFVAEEPTYGGPFEITVEDATHPSTSFLDRSMMIDEEIYTYRRNPRWYAKVLMTVDGAALADIAQLGGQPAMADITGGDHPIAWYKEFEGGRSWYTNLGHDRRTWGLPWFRQHVLEGLRWAAEGHATFSRFAITDKTANPIMLALRPDGRLYYIERTGEIRLWDPATGRVSDAAKIDVNLDGESGLQGIALHPDFATNRVVYLYYSNPIDAEDVLSLFVANEDGSIDLLTEVVLLRVPSARTNHQGGDLEFGPDGTLYLSVGDHTVPFGDARGYAPLDERPGMEGFNSQRTAGNPFDARGAILRLNDDGTIPAGNLYATDGGEGRPEIYIKGTRNPYRMALNPSDGRLYWGEVGPDAFDDSAERGPRGYDEVNIADAPGNYGWPFCIGDNFAYRDYDYQTELSGPAFDCSDFVPAALFYDYDTVTYLALGAANTANDLGFSGRSAFVPAFYPAFPDSQAAPFALPPSFQNKPLFTEWTRFLVAALDFSEATPRVQTLLPWERFIRPMDIVVAPDGALYVLEFGSAFFGNNLDAAVVRVEHSASGNLTPVAAWTASALQGPAGTTVTFNAEGSRAPARNADIASYEWDVDGDGEVDSSVASFEHTFDTAGVFETALTVVDTAGRRSYPFVRTISIGNTPPQVSIENQAVPGEALQSGVEFPAGISLTLVAVVTDAEDAKVDCEEVSWTLRLGHNTHAHPERTASGCTFTFDDTTLPPHSENPGERLFWALEASYTDQGDENGDAPLSGSRGIVINVTDEL